jgi:hypothetical protein
MKTLFTFIFLSLFSTISIAQSKKDLLLQKDSLLTVIKSNEFKIDSLKKVSTSLNLLYISIKERVLKADFNPESFNDILDSLQAAKDNRLEVRQSEKDSLNGVITSLQAKKDSAESKVKYFTELRQKQIVSDADIIELKKLKDLLNDGILEQDEFDRRRRVILGEPKKETPPKTK